MLRRNSGHAARRVLAARRSCRAWFLDVIVIGDEGVDLGSKVARQVVGRVLIMRRERPRRVSVDLPTWRAPPMMSKKRHKRTCQFSPVVRRTGNLRAVQLLFGHTKIEGTFRYLGVEVVDTLAISEQVDVQSQGETAAPHAFGFGSIAPIGDVDASATRIKSESRRLIGPGPHSSTENLQQDLKSRRALLTYVIGVPAISE